MTAERERWPLWLPVLTGVGIGGYFSLAAEPPVWVGGLGLAGAALGAWLLRRRLGAALVLCALAAVCLGFLAAQVRTIQVGAPVLTKETGPLTLTGRVVTVALRDDGERVILDRLTLPGIRPDLVPEKVRVRLRGEQPELTPGAWLRMRAVLMPPAEPSAPGGYDFQRMAYFDGVGAVGYAMGPAQVIAPAPDGPARGLYMLVAGVRAAITNRIVRALPGDEGRVAAALMTGERGAVPKPLLEAIRDSGLAHLLAISGLHVGLVAGIVFVGLRGGLALLPAVALRWPIKKWAAAAALIAAGLYAALVGFGVPTVRAFLMLAFVLVAVLIDREGISMRSLAWAALGILLLWPEALLGPSFQMSFAAVAALIASYEALRRRARRGPRPPWAGPLVYVGGVALTTVISTLATAPFVLYHFNKLALYGGLLANLAAVPLTALWVMPWAVAAFLLMPFGAEKLALVPAGLGIEAVIGVAETVATWPGTVGMVPAIPVSALAAAALGGLWMVIWRGRWRWAGGGGLALAAALSLGPGAAPPDLLVDGQGRLVALRTLDGEMLVSSRQTARFDRETWLRRAGLDERNRNVPLLPVAGRTADRGNLRCDALGCMLARGRETVAVVRDPLALAEDCTRATVVVSLVPVRGDCAAAHTVIDIGDLRREGTHALWISDGGVRIRSVARDRGDRPWVARRLSPAPNDDPDL